MTIAQRVARIYAVSGAALAALAAAGCSLEQSASSEPGAGERGSGRPVAGRVIAVTDGDTVRVALGETPREVAVRLIGIDTPETRKPGTPVQCGGPEATAHLERLVEPGDQVTLRGDRSQNREDRYGRLLAYVTPRGQAQLNRRQVAAGWARVYVYDERPFGQLEAFRRAEQGARRAARGVWAQCEGGFERAAP